MEISFVPASLGCSNGMSCQCWKMAGELSTFSSGLPKASLHLYMDDFMSLYRDLILLDIFRVCVFCCVSPPLLPQETFDTEQYFMILKCFISNFQDILSVIHRVSYTFICFFFFLTYSTIIVIDLTKCNFTLKALLGTTITDSIHELPILVWGFYYLAVIFFPFLGRIFSDIQQ